MKIGLVLEGGAHRTIFSCGVMDAFLDAQIEADYVIGASAGITYGVSYISKQKGRNREMLRRYAGSWKYAGIQHMLSPANRAYYNLKYTFDTIPNRLLPFDYETYQKFSGDVLAAVTNIETGEAEYFPVDGVDKQWRVLQATCALPLLFHPVILNGNRYADGGVADSIPYQKALEDGCDKVIVIVTRERTYQKHSEPMMRYATKHFQKKYPQYAECLATRHERYNACTADIAKKEADGTLYVIAPMDTFGVGRTERNTEKLMKLYAHGYATAMQQMSSLKTYLVNQNSSNQI